MTLGQRGSVLPRAATVFSQGAAEVWNQRRQNPAGKGGEEMVHSQMLPLP